MDKIIINNIEIEVQKKNIKNMHLVVLPPDGRVRVSAPKHMKNDAITRLIKTKIDWINKQQEKIKSQPKTVQHEYVTGENLYLWGELYQLVVVFASKSNSVKIQGDKIILKVREASTVEQREKVLRAWYADNLKRQIPIILEKWQPIIGVKVNEFGVKNMKTRWGTCNISVKRIWLNLQLVKKSPRCLEYVVVHELVHLLEKNHNKVFIAYMDKFLPDWRTTKEELNKKL